MTCSSKTNGEVLVTEVHLDGRHVSGVRDGKPLGIGAVNANSAHCREILLLMLCFDTFPAGGGREADNGQHMFLYNEHSTKFSEKLGFYCNPTM